MKQVQKIMMACMLMIGVLTLVTPYEAIADGTDSGTSITNRSTINYQVGGVAQTEIESSEGGNSTPGAGNGADTTFAVDNKVDLTVATIDVAAVTVNPGSTQAGGIYPVLEFTVTNDGNTDQDYALSATAVLTGDANAFAGTDAFDMSTVNIFVEDGTTAGYQVAEDTATFIDSLAKDAAVTVYIVADTPLTAANGQYASYHLRATTADAGTAGATVTTTDDGNAWVAGTVQVVFADAQGTDTANDAANDGQHSSQDDYIVAAAALTVAKTSVVDSDPFGSTIPKAVPGAIMEYTINITNNGTSAATTVVITDSIPANTEYVVGSLTVGDTIEWDGGSGWTTTEPAAADVTDIRVTFNNIAGSGGNASTTFQVEIQ